ncbi:MAG TPA: RsmE family RNA methyltransferase, partial [Myxococcales bacterium]|nr:RsmE family RNA methyltransferase [Myxococcales bacterium]
RIAEEAARQSGRSDVPAVDAPCTLADLSVLLRADPGRRGILLDPEEEKLRLSQAARGASRLLLAIGPEGGFTPGERAQAAEAGFALVGLGRRILRTETAGLAALSIIQHLAGDLG